MVRKRLSDLLREEGEKPAEPESGEPGEATQVKRLDQASGTASKKPAPAIDVAAHAADDPADDPVDDPVDDPATAATQDPTTQAAPQPAAPEPSQPAAPEPESQPETLQLEATVRQLKQDIEVSRQLAQAAAATFNQQIAMLQAKITEQDSSIQQLKAEAEAAAQQANQQASQQITQIKAELETARQTILQLSQVKPPKALPTAPARPGFLSRSQPPVLPSPAVLPSPRAAEPELEPSQSQMIIPGRAGKIIPERSSRHELELHKVLDHPTQPGSLPVMSSEGKPAEKESIKLSDTDVGWMD